MPTDQNQAKEALELSLEDLRNVKRLLDERSIAHCLAKWYQVTLNLHNGRSASCCLQPSKPLDLPAISIDHSQIHNSEVHVLERVALRQGQKIDECSACWNVEKEGRYSERHFKSADFWAIDKISESDNDPRQINPTYVEVSFSSQCQLRCSYCNPETSSSIAKEIEQNGAYPDRFTLMGSNDRSYQETLFTQPQPKQTNPYVDAFWKWLPGIYKDLKVLRVTGGEPFLSEDTFKFMDYVKENPNKEMAIEFNSNLSFPAAVFKRFEKAFALIPRFNYRSTTLYVSLDCWGDRAEYIRFGMRIKEIEKNIDRLLQQFPQMKLTITATISVLGIETFDQLLEKVTQLKDKWGKSRISLTAYPLVFPPFQAVCLASDQLQAKLSQVEAIALHSDKFSVREKEMISAIAASSRQKLAPNQFKKLKIDFYRFFKAYDERKKISLISTFPEHNELYKEGERLSFKEKQQWLEDIHSVKSQDAVIAIESLMRPFEKDEELTFQLITRLVRKDDLTLKYLLRLDCFSKASFELLALGLLDLERSSDIIKFISNHQRLRENLHSFFDFIIKNNININTELFYVWNNSILEHKVDKELWSPILANLYRNCVSIKERNELINSTKYLPKSYFELIKDLGPSVNAIIFKREPLDPSHDALNEIFTTENLQLANFFYIYISSIPFDRGLARALISTAKTRKQFAGQIANSLGVWRGKLSFCANQLVGGDAYVNALIAKQTGLDVQLTQSLLSMDEQQISETLAQWYEAGLKVDESLLASIIFDKTLSGKTPYKWLPIALKIANVKTLESHLLNQFMDMNHSIDKMESTAFFDMLKSFKGRHDKVLMKKFFSCAKESNFFDFIEFAKRTENVKILVDDFLDRVHRLEKPESLSVFYNMLVEQSIRIDLTLILGEVFQSKDNHWGLWEQIIENTEPNDLVKVTLSLFGKYPKLSLSVNRSYFKFFFSTKYSQIDLKKMSSQQIPFWWLGYLEEVNQLNEELIWSGLHSVKNDEDYWSIRDFLYDYDSFCFDLKSIEQITISDEVRYDLISILLSKKVIDHSVVASYHALLSNIGSKYIWSILENINLKEVSVYSIFYFSQAFMQSNLKDETYYSSIIASLRNIVKETRSHDDIKLNWTKFNSIFLDSLQGLDPNKRDWYMRQFLEAHIFDLEFWDIKLLKELDCIESQLLYLFYEKSDLSTRSYFNDLLSHLPLTSILSAKHIDTDSFVMKINDLNGESGFYCLQLRRKSELASDWSVDQVNRLKPIFQEEFYRIFKDLLPFEFWLSVSQSSDSLTLISVMTLPTDSFISKLNNESDEKGYYFLQLRSKSPHVNDRSVEQVNSLKPIFQDEFYRIFSKHFSSDFWLEVAEQSDFLSLIGAIYLPTNTFVSKINNENDENGFYSLQRRRSSDYASDWSIDQVKKLKPTFQGELYRIFNKMFSSDFWFEVAEQSDFLSLIGAIYLPTNSFVLKLNKASDEIGFYCIQIRRTSFFATDWSVDQVNSLKPIFQDELYRISSKMFTLDFWQNVANNSNSLSLISALYLPTEIFWNRVDTSTSYHVFLVEYHGKSIKESELNADLLGYVQGIDKEIVSCFFSNVPAYESFFSLYKLSNNDMADILEQCYLKYRNLPHQLLNDLLVRFIFDDNCERIFTRINSFDFSDIHSFKFNEDDLQTIINKNLALRAVKIVSQVGANSLAIDIALRSARDSSESIELRLAPLYFLCEKNVFSKVNSITKFISTLSDIPKHSEICWNLVDIIIDQKLDRALGYKNFVTSSLVSRVKPERPFLKLLAYFKGVVHTSSDM